MCSRNVLIIGNGRNNTDCIIIICCLFLLSSDVCRLHFLSSPHELNMSPHKHFTVVLGPDDILSLLSARGCRFIKKLIRRCILVRTSCIISSGLTQQWLNVFAKQPSPPPPAPSKKLCVCEMEIHREIWNNDILRPELLLSLFNNDLCRVYNNTGAQNGTGCTFKPYTYTKRSFIKKVMHETN